jgi:hypothetical protein
MTVPPWAGWEDALTGLLLLLVVLAVAAAVVLWSGAARTSASGRADWQAELEARSAGRRISGTGEERDRVGATAPGHGPDGACRRRASHRASA